MRYVYQNFLYKYCKIIRFKSTPNPTPFKFEIYSTFYILVIIMSCSETRKVLCGKKECSTCYNRSFATHPKSKYWSSKNEVEPYQVLKNSNKKY
jgi:hypothetical protein